MTEPTDAELWQLHMQMPGVHKNPIDFARAALAKWGTPPAVAGEPVAWLDPWTGAKATTDYDAYGKHGIPLYTAPQPLPTSQPTQAREIEALRKDAERYRTFIDCGQPICFLGYEYFGKEALDAAIDATSARL